MKTNKEHVKTPLTCPVCNAKEVYFGSIDITHITAYQEANCMICDATWDDTYQLIGYSNCSADGGSFDDH